MSTSTDQKLDELKELFACSIATMQKTHEETCKAMGDKLTKLEEDLAATKAQQEDATERTMKRARRERPLQFNRTGHEEQFHLTCRCRIVSPQQLGKLEVTDRDKAVIDKAREERAAAFNDCQKMIRLADSSENGWGAAREYKGMYNFADNEEDNTKMVNCD